MEEPGEAEDSYYVSVAKQHWLASSKPIKRAQRDVTKGLWEQAEKDHFAPQSLQQLESSQCLERYLWPAFTDDSPNQQVLLISVILNVKRRDGLPSWSIFADRAADFAPLFRRFLSLLADTSLEMAIRTHVLVTIIGAFQSLEHGFIRKECAPLVSVSIWHNLHSESVRNQMLEENGQFKKAWRAATKRFESADASTKARLKFDRAWLYTLILGFLDLLYKSKQPCQADRIYCERFLEFLSDLQSQFPTRRYVNTLLKDLNVLVMVKLSPMYESNEGGLIRDFYALLLHFTEFPLDDHTGRQFSQEESSELHNADIAKLQRTALKHYKDKLNLLALSSYGLLSQRQELTSHLDALSDEELSQFASLLDFRTSYPRSVGLSVDRRVVCECIVAKYEKHSGYRDSVRPMAILPTEKILYEASFIRNDEYNGSQPLALPKLNIQYLTIADFLWRSFILYRCETFYEIRSFLEETVKRLQPRKGQSNGESRLLSTRMALPITKPAVVEVVAPRVGELIPAEVKAEIMLDVSRLPDNVRKEWEDLRPDDVVFLLSTKDRADSKAIANGQGATSSITEAPYRYLRTAEIIHVLDDNGRPLRYTENQANGFSRRPRQRRLLVKLDAQSYAKDTAATAKGKPDVYENINMVIRRRSRENNFKPILESIRSLTLSDVPLPSWLSDVFLGMGDPSAASYKNLPSSLSSLDFRDTFVNWQHLRDTLPDKEIRAEPGTAEPLDPPYVLETVKSVDESAQPSDPKRPRSEGKAEASAPTKENASIKKATADAKSSKGSKKRRREEVEDDVLVETVKVSTYKPPNMGPYPQDVPKPNKIRFTSAQVEAITSGTQPGLTVIVGPPGTGKTDVATQIINNIYHNFPTERILLVAHSNQALNQLFQKIVALDIDERHLLRLGQGERDLQLDSEASYGRHGRVEHFLEQGQRLLAEVHRLAVSIQAPGAHGQSCETAYYFNSIYIQPVWKQYLEKAADAETAMEIIEPFPFHDFFSNAPQPLFPEGTSREGALEIVTGCYRHLEKIFIELEDIRPFEVLRRDREKANYLLVKEARIIAMTSTHAAMRRQDIANLGFHYDNLIMEEAAQVTEIEAFIPLALQKTRDGGESPLKRVVLCGDHLQNSPIIQNQAFRQYANLEQSLFLRLIRLGVPHIMLDRQGRARPSLAELYKWRYPQLSNLSHVSLSPEFKRANAGLRYDYQFIDVPDYKGRGETSPTPHFTQNLGEAEYAVALYMYMRLLGYPARSISILTPYAGQRALIRDVLGHRCAKNRLFGLPRVVTTVDKYQGEQNDYIILSLVRTRAIGYLRDPRRLTVALSRARLGLYVLGRRSVFESAPETAAAFALLLSRPADLLVTTGEMFPAERGLDDDTVAATEMKGVEHLGQYVFEMTRAKVEALRAGGGALPPADGGAGIQDEDEEDDAVVEEFVDEEFDDEGVDVSGGDGGVGRA